MSGPLAHVRVLDLSRVLAGPWAGQMLADLGADVVKVERPGSGDDTRAWGPPFLDRGPGDGPPDAAYFLAVNRGKRSVTLDLTSAEGQSVVRALAARSDILLENFKAGTLARFRLGYEDLRAANPRLVYCSITGFGQSGPRRDQAAYDFMIQAMGGLMSVTGQRDDLPGGGPQKVGVPIVDVMTGMYAAVAVLAALARREITGRGDWIDLGMLDVAVSMLANQAMNYLISGRVPARSGNAHPNIQPQDVYRTSDGHLAVAVGNDAQFVRFCEVLERPDLAQDERFRTNAGRVRHLAELSEVLRARLLERGSAAWTAGLEAAGVPAGAINDVAQVFADPQVIDRGMLVHGAHATAGTVPMVASPMRFRESPLGVAPGPPRLGEHTEAVLAELGLGDDAPIDGPGAAPAAR